MRISSADDRTIMTRLANQVKSAASSRELTDVHMDWIRAHADLE